MTDELQALKAAENAEKERVALAKATKAAATAEKKRKADDDLAAKRQAKKVKLNKAIDLAKARNMTIGDVIYIFTLKLCVLGSCVPVVATTTVLQLQS
jgi:hypothetical protein